MGWSLRIGRVFGINIYLHWTFLAMLVYLGYSGSQDGDSTKAAYGILFVLILFSIVVMHELGHSLMARRFGIGARSITLLPIGGVAQLERMPREPKQELLVAIAGPMVNVVLAAIIFVILVAAYGLSGFSYHLLNEEFGQLGLLLEVNIALVLFNMLPAFPMDGGRVLRALLATRLDYPRATRIAANVGKAMAVVFVVVGLWTQTVTLPFVALFVWIGADAESAMAQMRNTVGGYRVGHAMITDFHSLQPSDPLSIAVANVLAGFQQDFPVTDDGRLVGILTYNGIVRALSENGGDTPAQSVMQPIGETVSPYDMLDTILPQLQNASYATLPVVQDGRLIGLLTRHNVAEFMMLQNALHRTRPGLR